jgi:hypothetical protein
VTTADALQFFFQEKFIHQSNEKWAEVFTYSGATLFCMTDAVLTNLNIKSSVNELYRIRSALSKNLTALRDEDGKLPISQLVLLASLIPGGMLGAWFKGEVGVHTIARQMTSLFSENPPTILDPIFRAMAYTVGGCSAVCYFSFQGQQALTQMRIRRGLQDNAYWNEYSARKRLQIFGNQFVTFVISVAMTLITIMATFYHNNSFDVDPETAAKALFIGLSNMILNTWFTSGPNFLHKTIQADYKAQLKGNTDVIPDRHAHRFGIFLIQFIGAISSTGNSLAVFPAIVHILHQISKKEKITDESIGYVVAGIVITLALAFPMFVRDYAYYTKQVLELLFHDSKKPSEVASSIPETRGCCNWLPRFFRKSSEDFGETNDTRIQNDSFVSRNSFISSPSTPWFPD